MKYCMSAIGLVVFSWLGVTASAQPAAEPETPRQQVAGAFDRKAPKVGEPLPDMELLDAEGGKFNLASLRGWHTVLVFGCLT